MHTLQYEQDGFTDIDKLRDELLRVLRNIHKEKEEEKVIVDIWCHFGHAYITKVGEGEQNICCFVPIVALIDSGLYGYTRCGGLGELAV